MLIIDAQTQLADSMAQMMRCWALAANRTWTASALQGLSLWSEVLAPGTRAAAARDSYSSYRSGGGHAAAQVIVAGEDAALAGLTPLYGMLNVWRAAFGAGTSGRN